MIDIPGSPRSYSEMRFAVSLLACPECGSREIGPLESRGRDTLCICSGSCLRCGTLREVRFRPASDLLHLPTPPRYHLGGAAPSQVIRPRQWLDEIERLAPTIVLTPEKLAPAAWHAQWNALDRMQTCLTELAKFAPPDAGIPHAWIAAEQTRYGTVVDAYQHDAQRIYALEAIDNPPKIVRGELSSRTLEAHLQWVRRGRTGEGRLDIVNVNLRGVKVGAKDMSAAQLDGIIFDRCDLSFSHFESAALTDVSLKQAWLGNCTFSRGQLVRCDFLGSDLSIAKFEEAIIVGGRFDRASLDRASFRRAKVGGASFRESEFGNTVFDDAVFVDCDLRGADFALRTPRLLGTTERARFERCDLRDTRWEGRDLDNAVFIDCKMRGLSGRPRRAINIVIERPDLSLAGDGGCIGRDADVLAAWGSAFDDRE